MSIEQAAKEYARQNKPKYYAAEKALKRGLIWQAMEDARYCQAEAAREMGINRATLRSYIKEVFTNEEIKNMGMGHE